jgi:hypothetical protein
MAANTVNLTNADDPRQDAEKTFGSTHVNDASPSSKPDDDEEVFTPEEQRKIIHRIDRRLIATTGKWQHPPTTDSS